MFNYYLGLTVFIETNLDFFASMSYISAFTMQAPHPPSLQVTFVLKEQFHFKHFFIYIKFKSKIYPVK